jgi:hypothetical protein
VRGSSGAGVIGVNPRTHLLSVVGIIAGNAKYDLVPVEDYSVTDTLDGKTITEQTRFYLPAGVAIHVDHLRRLVATL